MNSHQLGICSWSLKPNSPEELIEGLHACDLNTVQLALVPLVEDPRWASYKSIFENAGINILSGMLEPAGEDYSTLATIEKTGGVREDSSWEVTLDRAKKIVDAAYELGLTLVSFHAGFLPEKQSSERRTLLDRIRIIADVFALKGISIALETGQETAPVLLGVLEELSKPNIGVNFDPANMILYGKGDPIDAAKMLSPFILQVHIKDAIPTMEFGTWGTEVVVGTGRVDWDAFLQVIPHDVPRIIEREAGEDRIGDIQKAISYIEERQ
ncbi:MAG: sugar phosphate isomerase/epimerase family protein [Phycisphaerales bacterium]|jgi:sugar phosphate isomerase/epimerase|nr:sugar phosphate isomerase/epimerase family protein [Phycisphaerales bacterium]